MDVNPRKIPRQARAKATADAIVEATTQLLLAQGYERFTTARAAERAGVSIGSLYQYFPNKAALVAAVIDRCCEGFISDVDRALAGRPRITLTDCIRAIVEVMLISHSLTPDLHKIVIDLAPRIGVADKTERASRKMAELSKLSYACTQERSRLLLTSLMPPRLSRLCWWPSPKEPR
jgi:AcrR family transcriptional regulator